MSKGNFKARCIHVEDENKELYTLGKVYEIKEGAITWDDGKRSLNKFDTIQDLNEMFGHKFMPVEDTITDILNKCAQLQEQGLSVTFTSHNGRIEIEHRNNEDFSLIVGFAMHDIENSAVLNAIGSYLDELLKKSVDWREEQ